MQLEVDLVQFLVRSYVTIVKKNIQDSVPKAAMHFLVTHVQTRIQNEVIAVFPAKPQLKEKRNPQHGFF